MPEYSPQEVRRRILNGRFYCVKELAEIAIDKQYLGFEDPRSAAGYIIGDKTVVCKNVDCGVSVRVSNFQETAEITGKCAVEDVCLAELWEEKTNFQPIDDVGIKTTSSEVLSYACPHINCSFHCGFTIDGGSGSGGNCQKTIPDTKANQE